MSALSYGCTSCSTVESFNGSLQGLQSTFGGNNNNVVNQMIADNNFNQNSGQNMNTAVGTTPQNNSADLRNNLPANNYNTPTMNNLTYGNGNQQQHPMNTNYNDVKVPQVIATSAKPMKPKHRPQPVVQVQETESKNKLGCYFKMGLIILMALALHETIKYYINHSIKFDEGSPTYFVYYTLACGVGFFVVNNYVKFE